jgi:hypothetical protein
MIQISLVIMLDYAANAYASNFFEPVVLAQQLLIIQIL